MYRHKNGALQVFLAHPGGPLFARKDLGCWSIPKGEPPEGETLMDAAMREFEEETGMKPQGPYIGVGSIRQKGGKMVHAWAFEGDCDDSRPIRSNLFEMEWPPRSGCMQGFPEVDRAQFFPLAEAKRKIKDSQWPLVERLAAILEEAAKNAG